VTALTAGSLLDESSSKSEKAAAGVVDFFNPASDIKDIMDLSDEHLGTEFSGKKTSSSNSKPTDSETRWELGEDYFVGRECFGRLDCAN